MRKLWHNGALAGEMEAADVLVSSHTSVFSSANVHWVSISRLQTANLNFSIRGRLYNSLEVLKTAHGFLKWRSQ